MLLHMTLNLIVLQSVYNSKNVLVYAWLQITVISFVDNTCSIFEILAFERCPVIEMMFIGHSLKVVSNDKLLQHMYELLIVSTTCVPLSFLRYS